MSASSASTLRRPLRVSYTRCAPGLGTATRTILLGASWLAGEQEDLLFRGASPAGEADGLALYCVNGLLVGYGSASLADNVVATSRELYRRALEMKDR
jgi:hypothetical protein